MRINLTRDLVFFDLETTGLNVIRDRIVQIAMVKLRKTVVPMKRCPPSSIRAFPSRKRL